MSLNERVMAEKVVVGLLDKIRDNPTYELKKTDIIALKTIEKKHPEIIRGTLGRGTIKQIIPTHKKVSLDYYDHKKDKNSKNFYPNLDPYEAVECV